jgi:hypothetical protein
MRRPKCPVSTPRHDPALPAPSSRVTTLCRRSWNRRRWPRIVFDWRIETYAMGGLSLAPEPMVCPTLLALTGLALTVTESLRYPTHLPPQSRQRQSLMTLRGNDRRSTGPQQAGDRRRRGHLEPDHVVIGQPIRLRRCHRLFDAVLSKRGHCGSAQVVLLPRRGVGGVSWHASAGTRVNSTAIGRRFVRLFRGGLWVVH